MEELDGELITLSKRDHTLSPIIKQFKLQQDNDMLTPFDFFRYLPPPKKDALQVKMLKRAKRIKVHDMLKFCKHYREGKVDLPVALTAIRFLEEHRQLQRSKLKMFDKAEVQKQIGQGNLKSLAEFEST